MARWEPRRSWLLGRQTELFIRSLTQRMAAGAMADEATLTEAGMDAWSHRMGNVTEPVARAIALRRAKRAIRNPDVASRFTDLFELGGFDVNDATKAHIAFIRDGNYQALKDYWTMTQGPITRKIDVRAVHVNVDTERGPRNITPRVLGNDGESDEDAKRD